MEFWVAAVTLYKVVAPDQRVERETSKPDRQAKTPRVYKHHYSQVFTKRLECKCRDVPQTSEKWTAGARICAA